MAQTSFRALIGTEQTTGDDMSRHVVTSDGGMLAMVSSGGARSLFKFDASAEPQWSFRYGITAEDTTHSYDMAPTSDGGAYLIIDRGFNTSFDEAMYFLLIRIDANGQVLWSKRYVTPIDEWFSNAYIPALRVLPDDALQVIYYDISGVTGPEYLFKIGGDGSLIWARRSQQGMNGGVRIADMLVTSDGGTIVMLNCFHPSGFVPLHLARLAQDGTMLWNKSVRMTNAGWMADVSSFLVTANTHSYVLGFQFEQPGSTTFPFLIKVDATGQLEWYRIYGSGFFAPQIASGSAIELLDGSLQFGSAHRAMFDTSGTMLSMVHYSGPGSWTAGSSTYTIHPLTGRYGTDHLVHGGWLDRMDDLFQVTWRTPLIGRVDLNDLSACGWTSSTLPLLPDTIVPSAFIEYEDVPLWIPIAVNAADTAISAFPITLPITPYCSLTGISDAVTKDSGLVLSPSLAQAGSLVGIHVPTAGSLMLWNAAGQCIRTERMSAGSNALSTANLTPGIYSLQLVRDDRAPSDFARLMIE